MASSVFPIHDLTKGRECFQLFSALELPDVLAYNDFDGVKKGVVPLLRRLKISLNKKTCQE